MDIVSVDCPSSKGTAVKKKQIHFTASDSVSPGMSKDFINMIAGSFNEGQRAEPGPRNKKRKIRSRKLKINCCFVCQYMESASKVFFKYIKQTFKETVELLCECKNKTLCQCTEVYQTEALKKLCIKHKNDFVISVKGNFCSRSSPGSSKQERKDDSDVSIKDDLDNNTEDDAEDDDLDDNTEDDDLDDSTDDDDWEDITEDDDDWEDIIEDDDVDDCIENDDLDVITEDDLNNIIEGFSECEPDLLRKAMRTHLQSSLHSLTSVLCGKSNKVLENLFMVAQFFAENCISDDANQPFLSVVTRMIKNVTADWRNFVPPFGNNIDYDDELLRCHFLFDEEKRKYICIQCLRFISTISDPLEKNAANRAESKKGSAGSSKCGADKEKLGQVSDTKYIENLCLAGQFFASFYIPDRVFREFCSLLDIIAKNVTLQEKNYVHPLGFFASSIKPITNAKQACSQSCKEEIQNKFKRLSDAKNELPKFMLAVHNCVAEDGDLRIYVVGTYVGQAGLPQEIMLSAASLKGEKPMGTARRLKLKVLEMVDPKQIAILASNRECFRENKTEQDILSDMKANGFHEKLIFLQDISSACENLLRFHSPSWVGDAMLECSAIYGYLNNPRIASPIQEYVNMNESLDICFFPPECLYDISFMSKGLPELWYLRLSCILKNVEVIVKSLPPFVKVLQGFHTLHADTILKSVCNPVFIAKLLVLEHVLKELFLVEKAAKEVSFTSFDYIRVINHMKSEFEAGCFSVLENAHNLLVTGIYNINVDSLNKIKQRSVNLADIRSKCYPSSPEVIDADGLGTMFQDWINSVVEHVDDHITIPESFLLISSIFADDNKSVNERVPDFRKLFSLLPVDFVVCSKDCLGSQECTCVTHELERFFSHMHDLIKTNSTLYKDEKQKPVYKNLFAYYLSQANDEKVRKLNIVNVLRVLEVIQLMKASNSGTQRVASVVSKYFKIDDDPFRYSKHLKYDIIDISAFLAMNSDVQSMNTTACCQKFLAAYSDADEDECEEEEDYEDEEDTECYLYSYGDDDDDEKVEG